jgi:hypothetical protein
MVTLTSRSYVPKVKTGRPGTERITPVHEYPCISRQTGPGPGESQPLEIKVLLSEHELSMNPIAHDSIAYRYIPRPDLPA